MDARVHVFTATALEIGWLVLCSAAFTPGEIPRYSFYRMLSGPQDQSGHEGVKKNLHPSDTRDRTRAVQPVAKRLAACATWLPSHVLLGIGFTSFRPVPPMISVSTHSFHFHHCFSSLLFQPLYCILPLNLRSSSSYSSLSSHFHDLFWFPFVWHAIHMTKPFQLSFFNYLC